MPRKSLIHCKTYNQRYCILRNRDGKLIYGMVPTSKGDVISVETMLVVCENGGKELKVVSHRLLGAFISVYFYLFTTS